MHAFQEYLQSHKHLLNKHITIQYNPSVDGLAATVILMKTLQSKNTPFTLLCSETIKEATNTIVIDHTHDTHFSISTNAPSLKKYNIDGTNEISCAGIAHLFSKSNFSHLAIIGALAQQQEHSGFSGCNALFLEESKQKKNIIVRKSLRIKGLGTKPLTQALCESDLDIPTISGVPGAAEKLLYDLGISVNLGTKEITYDNLTTLEQKKLIATIIDYRKGLDNPKDVFWNTYHAQNGIDLRDMIELIDATIQLKKPSIGIGVLLEDSHCIQSAKLLQETLKEIKRANQQDATSAAVED